MELNKRAEIDLEAFRRVAWEREAVTVGETAMTAMAAARKSFIELIDSDEDIVIYGVTTGYGHMASKRLNKEERKLQAKRPPVAAASSFGEPLPDRVVRGIILARLANFLEGHAAMTPANAVAVADMLKNDRQPAVPCLGNGCPGEIQALAHLFGDLASSLDLGEKDSLSFINGSPCASALVADAALAARRRLALATQVFALSIEAIKAPLGHYDAQLDPIWEDPFETDALVAIRDYIDGGLTEDRRPYQAPVSYRIMPRVLGQAGRAVAQAEEVAAISLKAVSDNPVYIPPHESFPLGKVMSTGGYHNAKAYPAMDSLAAVWADLAQVADRHSDHLPNARISLLPDGLRKDGGYLGGLCFASAGFTEQARLAAQRVFLPGMGSGGYGQNDVQVPVFHSWRKEAEAGRAFDATLAILAVIASQAFFITERKAPPKLAGLVEEVQTVVPPVEEMRALGSEVEALAERFTKRVYGEA